MNKDKHFSSENILMSTALHLVLVALMVISMGIVIHRATLVAPDRVQIMEIDLTNVKITRDETMLYNTDAPAPQEQETRDKVQVEEVGDDKPIDKPTLVENKSETKNPKSEIKKTVVRVNRESVSLNRTMTVSVVDALRIALTRCWSIDTMRDDIADIRAVAHLTMNKNGTVRDVWFESAARAETDTAYAYVLETIRAALNSCQPFRMLPENEFDAWEKIQLNFYPDRGQIL